MKRNYLFLVIVILMLAAAGVMLFRTGFLQPNPGQPAAPAETQTPVRRTGGEFDGEQALKDVEFQVSLGPRLPGSQASAKFLAWAGAELKDAGWVSEIQPVRVMEHDGQNLVARREADAGKPVIILGAHYDSRLVANNDPDPAMRGEPVPGANDGGSGVAVLLEIARVLPEDLDVDVWLVFFDLEDQGNQPGWDWSLGARGFVENLVVTPEAAVIVDMVGDADLNLYIEGNSTRSLVDEIWAEAAALNYPQFINQPKHNITDDHIPFLRAGIPAVDIIDIEYAYWHTVADTPDKVSAGSLKAVGDTVLAWLKNKYGP